MAKKLAYTRLVKGLRRLGFELVSQRGSHQKFKRRTDSGELVVIVPNYREIPAGTVQSILRQAQVTWEEFEATLQVNR